MTAINIIRTGRAVHIATDAAAYDETGIVHWFGPKVVTFPHMPAVISVGGTAGLLFQVGQQIEKRAATFDELVSGDAVTASVANLRERGWIEDDSGMVIIVAGWSAARRKPEFYLWRPGFPPRLEMWIAPMLIAPNVPIDVRTAAGVVLRSDMDGPPMWRAFVDLMELQRRLPEPYSRVGGCVQLTTVTADGISQKILHRWNDRIGDLIKPEPIDWQARRMNRKARRAA